MGAITILIVMLILVALSVGGYFAYKKLFPKSSGRKYNMVYSSDKIKGACDPSTGGTAGPKSTKSSDCAAACDAVPTTCNGYDWDGSNGCTLYATLPTKAAAPTSVTDKNECNALSK
jgi:hypothetical protein